jgi:hypothetical protein
MILGDKPLIFEVVLSHWYGQSEAYFRKDHVIEEHAACSNHKKESS